MELSVFLGIHHTALFDWLAQLSLGLMRNAGRRERRGPFSHPLCMSLPNGRAPQKARSLIKSTTLQRLNLSSVGGDATRARLGFRSSGRDGGAGKHPGGKGKCTGQSRDTITTGSIAARGFAGLHRPMKIWSHSVYCRSRGSNRTTAQATARVHDCTSRGSNCTSAQAEEDHPSKCCTSQVPRSWLV